MKALTISQPYASLIADGKKFVENRFWSTRYRGQLAIHAGKGTQYLTKNALQHFPNGCVIAIAKLTTCLELALLAAMDQSTRLPFSTLTIADVLRHEHTEGPWCWVLVDVKKLATPIPATGAQGLWEWDASSDLAERQR